MNNGLFRIHRVIFYAYAGFAAIMAIIGIEMLFRGEKDAAIGLVGIGLLPIAVIHWYAAKGASQGKRWGRITSIIIACVMLFGFPLGTFIALYI
jgi:hypothetical protein